MEEVIKSIFFKLARESVDVKRVHKTNKEGPSIIILVCAVMN